MKINLPAIVLRILWAIATMLLTSGTLVLHFIAKNDENWPYMTVLMLFATYCGIKAFCKLKFIEKVERELESLWKDIKRAWKGESVL